MTATGKPPTGTTSKQPKGPAASSPSGDAPQKMRDRAERLANDRKHDMVERARALPEEAHKIGAQLRDDGMGTPAEFLEEAAERVGEALDYLDSTPLDELARDIGQRARNSPLIYMGAAFGLGFVGTRFVRAATDDPSPEPGSGRPLAVGGSRRTLPSGGAR